MVETKTVRPISEIAEEIRKLWKPIHSDAKPYVDAMIQLNKATDMYICDPASDVCARFLNNAKNWRGEDARRIKALFGWK